MAQICQAVALLASCLGQGLPFATIDHDLTMP
jgi:hypothetical protein